MRLSRLSLPFLALMLAWVMPAGDADGAGACSTRTRCAVLLAGKPAITAPPITFDPVNIGSGLALSNGNLTATVTANTSNYEMARSTVPFAKKTYVEGVINHASGSGDASAIGIINALESLDNYPGPDANGAGIFGATTGVFIGNVSSGTTPAWNSGDTIGLAFDPVAKLVWLRNISSPLTWNAGGTADPAAGVGGLSFAAVSGPYYVALAFLANAPGAVGDHDTINFGATVFKAAPPAGFSNQVGASFALGQVPFISSSSWNTPIPGGATYTPLVWPASTGSNYFVNWASFSTPIYVATASDPVVAVNVTNAGWGYPAGTVNVHIPSGATGAPGSDGKLVVVNGTTVYSFAVFSRTNDTAATAFNYGFTNIVFNDGWGTAMPFLGVGTVSTGSSDMAGLLVQAETDAGEIQHALQITLDTSLQSPGFVSPAIAGDGSSGSGIAIAGQRLAIPQGTSMPGGLSPLGQKVFRVLINYGAYDIDTGGATSFRAQQNAYDTPTIAALDTDAPILMRMLQKVNHHDDDPWLGVVAANDNVELRMAAGW